MTSLGIRAEGISKLYRIGLREKRHDTFVGALLGLVKSPVENLRRLRAMGAVTENNADDEDIIWALRDVTFEVQEGEVLGVIGANGAGKSTLLRILSGITEPTSGQAEIHGQIASLLEVGTGFHPELTGRENVFLNGTILGMSKAEVAGSFDEIVHFSGVEKFIDTPVKRYSSGMKVRLGFAVAAHLKPEILLIDEVLAVGDLAFQQKCLGKMGEVARGGRTILFVSHNMAAVEGLCDTAIVLQEGRLVFHGSSREAVQRYVCQTSALTPDIDLFENPGRLTSIKKSVLKGLTLRSSNGTLMATFPMGSDIEFAVRLVTSERLTGAHIGIGINNVMGQRLCTLDSKVQSPVDFKIEGAMTLVCCWPGCQLLPSEYLITVWIKCYGEVVDVVENAGRMAITAADIHGTGRVQPLPGIFEAKASWEVVTSV